MNCSLDNSLNKCGFTIAGIKKIMLLKFSDIYDFEYDNDNLNYIKRYKLRKLPIEIKTYPESSFTSDYQILNYRFFKGSLTTLIAEMDIDKRNEFESIIRENLAIIIQDKMGKCWLFGQEKPVRLNEYSISTGAKDGFNGYRLKFDGESRNQIRQIECFDGCFTSFDGNLYTQTVFAIEDASTFSTPAGTNFQLSDGTSILSYNTLAAMDFTLWGINIPQTLSDAAELNTLLNGLGIVGQLIYDAGNDRAILVIQSTTNSFSALSIDLDSPRTAYISSTVNLQLSLGDALENSPTTNVIVRDSLNNIVYQGNPNAFLNGSYLGVTGYVRDAWVNVTLLYPNGTTFTAEVENFDCENRSYSFVLPPIQNCVFETEFSIHLGRTYNLDIPKIDPVYFYRATHFVFGGLCFDVLNNLANWTDDFAQYKDAIELQLNTYIVPEIDYSTLSITDETTYTRIHFQLNQANYDANNPYDCYAVHFAPLAPDVKVKTDAIPYNNVNLNIQTASDSEITIIDNSALVLQGDYGNAPTLNGGYNVETLTGISDGEMQDILFDINDYLSPTPSFNIGSESVSCPTSTGDTVLDVVPDTTDSNIIGKYQQYSRSILGEADTTLGTGITFEFTTFGNIDVVVPSSASFLGDLGEFTSAANIQLQGFARIMDLTFSVTQGLWMIEVLILTDELAQIISNGTVFWDRNQDSDAYRYNFIGDAPQLYHLPNQSGNWDFTSYWGVVYNKTDELKLPLNVDRNFNGLFDWFSLEYKTGGDIDINTPNNVAPLGNFSITFWDAYPSTGNLLAVYTHLEGTLTSTEDLDADAISNGGVTADITYIQIQSTYLSWIIPYSPTTNINTEVFFNENVFNRDAWGRFYGFYSITDVTPTGAIV